MGGNAKSAALNSGVIKEVQSQKNALGYASVGEVNEHRNANKDSGVMCVDLVLKNIPRSATTESIQRSVQLRNFVNESLDTCVHDPLELCWPITSYTFVAMHKHKVLTSCERKMTAAMFWYFYFVSNSTLDTITRMGFVPLSKSLRQESQNRFAREITCGEQNNQNLADYMLTKYGLNITHNFEQKAATWCMNNRKNGLRISSCLDVEILGTIYIPKLAPVIPLPTVRGKQEELGGTSIIVDGILVFMLTIIEHVTVVRMYSSLHSYDVDLNKELVALGMTNTVGGLFSTFLTGCAFSRSAVSNLEGGQSQISNLISAITIVSLTYTLHSVLYFLPRASLSSIILVSLVKVMDVKGSYKICTSAKLDGIVLIFTLIVTLVFGAQMGIICAICMSLAAMIGVTSQPRVKRLARVRGTTDFVPVSKAIEEDVKIVKLHNCSILRIDGPLCAANSARTCHIIEEHGRRLLSKEKAPDSVCTIILDMTSCTWADVTGATQLTQTSYSLLKRGCALFVASCNTSSRKLFLKFGMGEIVPEERWIERLYDAVVASQSWKQNQVDSMNVGALTPRGDHAPSPKSRSV